MKTVNLERQRVDLDQVIKLAKRGPVLLLTAEGEEYYVTGADDFDAEVESLRASKPFQRFLDKRAGSKRRIPLEVIEREIDRELAKQRRKKANR